MPAQADGDEVPTSSMVLPELTALSRFFRHAL
jgi:hypothetical protein